MHPTDSRGTAGLLRVYDGEVKPRTQADGFCSKIGASRK